MNMSILVKKGQEICDRTNEPEFHFDVSGGGLFKVHATSVRAGVLFLELLRENGPIRFSALIEQWGKNIHISSNFLHVV